MGAYIFVLLYHLVFIKSRSYLIFIGSFCLLFVVMAFRGEEIGTDAANYKDHLSFIGGGVVLVLEPLWVLLNTFVANNLNGDYRWIIIFSSILTLVPFYIGIIKSKIRFPLVAVFLYVFLYYYFYSFNIIRQSIAINIVFLALVYLHQGKRFNFIVYCILILIAMGFHYTAVLGFIFYFVYKLKINFKNLIIWQLLTFLVGFVFIDFAVRIFTSYFYIQYSTTEFGSIFGNLILAISLNVIFICFSYLVSNRDIWYNYFCVFILCTNLFIRVPFGDRILLFIGISQFVFLSNLVAKNNLLYNQKSLVLFLVIFYGLFTILRLFGLGEVLPYSNVLF